MANARICGAALLLCLLGACRTSVSSADLVTGASIFHVDPASDAGPKAFFGSLSAQDGSVFWGGLAQAAVDLGVETEGVSLPDSLKSADDTEFLPDALKNSVMKKVVQVNMAALHGKAGAVSDFSFKSGEMESFVRSVMSGVGLSNVTSTGDAKLSSLTSAEQRGTSVGKRIHQYLIVYFAGKFVDRSGNQLSKPEIQGSVGNDTIVAFLTVILEAFYDSVYSIPVYYTEEMLKGKAKKTWLTANGKRPTVAVLYDDVAEKITEGGKIQAIEVQAMNFFGQVAGEQSKALSGFVIRIFADVELGFIIGGHFSIGDNDTLAKVVETFFEVSSRRATEALAYRYFRSNDPNAGKLKDFLELLGIVYDQVKKAEKEDKGQ